METAIALNEHVLNIRKLYGCKRDALCVYQVLSNCFMSRPMSKYIIEEIIQKIIGFSLLDSTNADNICKYVYIMSLQKDESVGIAIRRIFLYQLENLYKDRDNKSIIKNSSMYRNLVHFFMCATHYMRNPMKPPVDDLVSALLILIHSLNCSDSEEDLAVFAHAVAWIGSYFNKNDESTVTWIAWREALDELRRWITKGKGSVWALCCLEAGTNGGKLSMRHLPFYAERLHQSQKQALLGISNIIPLPTSSVNFFNLSNILNFIQNV
ncbi:uncharacterized protein [Halyomorpha halys]|uniref:uncharacterized protein n=1 Tax=Halyomorpha halys TaxID=286706 RepID=UPI0006D5167B|nr:uncharacterized protein LOC106685520 [Halyomorpha halys]XP_014283725.1 uncharacterized protein LOC106685520 [Halyomorpha halys]XP_014283726.1 uncharacterized protein LOC106685520 [Halyomorpha halys]XP_014283727.1 uncharacterized protein LOC106685520 [Halyomorpha halys]XP_014283728.1 uncharacterized protein LOC106685520 [Halyomorpha halys]